MNDYVSPHNARHDAYVEKGWCPSIYTSKAWCNLNAGHTGKHRALRVLPDGRFVLGVEWDETGEWR